MIDKAALLNLGKYYTIKAYSYIIHTFIRVKIPGSAGAFFFSHIQKKPMPEY